MVELRHLRYFIAVAEELNFSRAAERLHMAQPPLSAAIRRLERDLGVDLFVRTTREVRLTDAGRAFLDGARRTLADADRASEDANRAAAGELGQLRIAYSWSTRFETLPALGRAFRATYPDVELLAQEMWNARMPAAFASGSIDIALSLSPEIAAELQLEPIRKCPRAPAAARLASSAARSASASVRRAPCRNALPASVSLTSRVVRTKSSTPRSRSSCRIAALSGGCAMCSRSAARLKFSSSATAMK